MQLRYLPHIHNIDKIRIVKDGLIQDERDLDPKDGIVAQIPTSFLFKEIEGLYMRIEESLSKIIVLEIYLK